MRCKLFKRHALLSFKLGKKICQGYEAHITTCIHKGFIENEENGGLGLIKMIQLAKQLGIKKINMHDLFKSGIPRDIWTGDIDTSKEDYVKAFSRVLKYKEKENDISIRMPQCIITQKEFDCNPEYYGYCSVKQFDRILAFPNGMLRVCSLMIGSPYCVGYYDSEKIYWNDTPTNEVLGHKMQEDTPCTNQNKSKHFKAYVPLCVSFKPKQDEMVWVNKLKWEEKRNEH